jgi:hypothetical protein
MQAHGWTHSESKKVLEWRKDLGGEVAHFTKGPYSAELFYPGPTPRYNWTYSLSISVKLPLFGTNEPVGFDSSVRHKHMAKICAYLWADRPAQNQSGV